MITAKICALRKTETDIGLTKGDLPLVAIAISVIHIQGNLIR